MPKTLVFGAPEGGEPCLLNVGLGSQAEVSRGHGNVCFRGQSGPQIRAAACLFLAEGVEEVGAERFFATIVLANRA